MSASVLWTATVGDGGSVILGNVPVGTSCTGSEADPGPDWDGSGETSLIVEDDAQNDLFITNIYEPVVAVSPLIIKKRTVGDVPADQMDTIFSIDVYCDGEYLTTVDREIDVRNLTVDAPLGASCTANEPNIPPNWVLDHVTDAVVTADGNAQVTVWNAYVPSLEIAPLIIKKRAVGDVPADQMDTIFSIDVYCDGEYLTTVDREIDVRNLTVDAPLGASCTASEPVLPDGWAFNRVNTVTVLADGSAQVTVWNEWVGQPPALALGCTPGFWKRHQAAWDLLSLDPYAPVSSVFSSYTGDMTLIEALQGGGGPGIAGKTKILLRAAVAGWLNINVYGADYPYAGSLVADVNAALASGSGSTMTALAAVIDAANNDSECNNPGGGSGSPIPVQPPGVLPLEDEKDNDKEVAPNDEPLEEDEKQQEAPIEKAEAPAEEQEEETPAEEQEEAPAEEQEEAPAEEQEEETPAEEQEEAPAEGTDADDE